MEIFWLQISYLATIISGIIILLLIINKRSAERFNIVYGLTNASMVVWALGRYATLVVSTEAAALAWTHFLYVGSILVHIFFLHSILVFIGKDRHKIRKQILYAFYINAIFLLAINVYDFFLGTNLFLAGVTSKLNFQFYEVPGIFYNLHLVNYIFIPTYAFFEMLLAMRVSYGITKQQLKYILISSVLGFVGGNSVVPLIYGIALFPWLAFLIPFHLLTMAYAILRYRLMDIKIVLRASFVYTISIFIVLFVAFAVREGLNAIFVLPLVMADALALLISIAVYDRVRRYAFRFANKYFFTSLYDSKAIIRDFSDVIGSTIEAHTIYNIISSTINNALYPKHFSVLLRKQKERQTFVLQHGENVTFSQELKLTKSTVKLLHNNAHPIVTEELERQENTQYQAAVRELQRLGIAVVIPLKNKDNFIGMIALGHKEAGDMYTQEDLELLRIIGRQAAIAIDNGLLYDEVRQFNEKLQARVERATADLRKRTKDLEIANAQLRRLDEAKSEFISIASHQLRTPLTAIKGYGSMLLEGDFGKISQKRQFDAVERMVISNNRLITLVENLLNVSRIESGRIKFSMQPMQVEDLAREVCETLRNSAEKQELYLQCESPEKPLPPVSADQEKIRQVLINFVDNAIKYTRKGGITVTVNEHENMIRCCVKDTGMGIDAEEQRKLFKKFSRGKDAFTVNTEGTGLGLYVAQMMIEGHKGKVWVESEGEGKGSSFCFELPVGKKESDQK